MIQGRRHINRQVGLGSSHSHGHKEFYKEAQRSYLTEATVGVSASFALDLLSQRALPLRGLEENVRKVLKIVSGINFLLSV